MRDQHLERNPPRDVQRALGFADRLRARVAVGARQRQRRAPPSRRKTFADRRVDAVQLGPSLGEPLLQISDGGRAVIVEMRPRGEYLDRLETNAPRSR